MNSIPLVSVIMPVYNSEKYLTEAIESILNQTCKNFEFLIINDGSTDKTESMIKRFSDKRIKYYKNAKNMGIAETMNRGLKLAKGKYIARMDADDVSLPRRLEKEVTFLNKNPGVYVCGSLAETFGETHKVWNLPTSPDEIKVYLLFGSPIVNSSALFRNDGNISYNKIFEPCEDYDLWIRICNIHKMTNLGEVLVNYRDHVSSTSRKKYKKVYGDEQLLFQKLLTHLGISVNNQELRLYTSLRHCNYKKTKNYINKTLDLLKKIEEANIDKNFFDKNELKSFLGSKFFNVLRNYYGTNLKVFKKMYKSGYLINSIIKFPVIKIREIKNWIS